MSHLAWEITVTFKRQVQVLKATTYKVADDIIEEDLPDMSIIDFGFEDGHGEDLIAKFRKRDRNHPIIVQYG